VSDRPEHLVAASTSLALAKFLAERPGDPQERAWIPTALYHVAVQLFEAAEATYGLHYVASSSRLAALSVRYPDAAAGFRKLRQLSETWRYQGTPPSDREIGLSWAWAQQVSDIVDERWPTSAAFEPDRATAT
jgi:hypothetical protein